ncbi:outer membrane beta-barrel protein [Neiella sp. HB171785]|uniref:Outer membrane beta-barrel protein n=1 Tax=Neiella litorisoli TaxID=2771431 RepID=A0A8J6QVE6_9GAMM|nr:outer membrane beta-barrel protein [Neiella litorisoli]MBD1391282.1 outer membrane beta-barrel protein [Neiella litorisoli]
MKRTLSACLLMLHAPGFASSWELVNPPLTSPFYVGGGVGYGQVDADHVDQEWQANWQVYAGYRFDTVWAIELASGRYADVDGVKDNLPSVAIDHNYNVSLSLLGFAYYSDFSAFYRLGLQYDDYDKSKIQQQADDRCAQWGEDLFRCAGGDSQVSYLLGLGAEFPLTDALVTRLEWISQLGGSDFNQHQAVASLMLKF